LNIDKRLNLVIPIEDEGRITAYVHSMPISEASFRANYMVIAKTFSAIYGQGLAGLSGPRVALYLMEEIAKTDGVWEKVEKTLIADMRRLSNFIVPGQDPIPLQEALDKKLISPEDASEVENAIAFFTVTSSMHRKAVLEAILEGAMSYWSGQITRSSPTEFAASLKTLTAPVSTGAKETLSSIPS